MMRLRMLLAAVGLGLSLGAIASDNQLVTYAAIGVLAVALALRFVTPRKPPEGPSAQE